VDEVSRGCWKADYTPKQDGQWILLIEYKGDEAFKRSMEFHPRAEGSHTTVVRPPSRVKVGEPSSFQLQARDRMGNALGFGGEKFECSVSGPPSGVAGFTITDHANGTYVVKFTLKVAGEFEFGIKLRGREVDGSPVVIHGV